MNRISKFLLAPLAVLVLGGYAYYPPEPPVPPTGGAKTPGPVTATLNATVGPGTTISIKKAGKTFKTLAAGKYKIIVDDKATNHNSRLTGPSSFNKATTLADLKKVTWTVTLKKGTFNFVCDPHSGFMKGSFKVN